MQSSKIIESQNCRIDFSNLCGGNDYAALTDGYNRKKIDELISSVDNYIDRKYLIESIRITKKIDRCPEDDDEQYFALLAERNDLQNKYLEERNKESAEIYKEIANKQKGYNARESAVLMYFLNDQFAVNTTNNGEKNCLQKKAQEAYSKVFGWSKKSYEGMINLDFTDPATRTAMEKVAKDFQDINPKMVKEIWHQYDEYEQDFCEKYPEKIKKRV